MRSRLSSLAGGTISSGDGGCLAELPAPNNFQSLPALSLSSLAGKRDKKCTRNRASHKYVGSQLLHQVSFASRYITPFKT